MEPAPPADVDGRSAWAQARLADERSGLLARVAAMESDMGLLVEASVYSNADDEHDPEGQTIAYERSQLGALTEQVRQRFAEVDAALARVAAGAYGVCEICGEAIDPDRLDARPTARTCMAHAPGARRGL